MTSRTLVHLCLATTGAIVFSACGAIDNTDTVARVGDAEIDSAEFDPLLDEYIERGDVFGTSPPIAGRISGDETRGLLSAVVQQTAFRSFLADNGVDADEQRQAFLEQIAPDNPIFGVSGELLTLIAELDPAVQAGAVQSVEAADTETLRALYADNPTLTGLTCVRHILVETEPEAEDVLAELTDGGDFEALAVERSIDPTAADTGGAIANLDNACVPIETVLQSFDPGFTLGVLQAREGIPSKPVESSFGWHVILHRPFDEVADSVDALHQPGLSGGLLLDGYVATVDVDVTPRYGTWDPATGAIVPLG